MLAAVAAILLSGCAEVRWHKEGVKPSVLERDLAECQEQAQLRARREAPLFGQPPPAPVGMDSRGQVVTGYAGRYDTDRALMENDFTRACMQGRGYRLAPSAKPVSRDS